MSGSGQLVFVVLLSGSASVASGTGPTQVDPAAKQDCLRTIPRLDSSELEIALRELTADIADPFSLVFSCMSTWLVPHRALMAREEVFPDPRFDAALAHAGHVVAALGPDVATPLANRLASANHRDLGLTYKALETLGSEGRSAIPILKDALESEDYNVRRYVAVGLAYVDGPDYPTLRAALGSDDPNVRAVAAIGLGSTRSPMALELLLAMLQEPNLSSEVRRELSRAFRSLGPVAVPVIPRLLASNRVSSHDLGKLGEAALPALSAGLEDAATREKAIHALASMGRPAGPILRASLRRDDPWWRGEVARAVKRTPWGLEALTPDLVGLLADPSPWTRIDAIGALKRLGSGEEGLSAVLAAAKAPHPRVAYEAIVALGDFEEGQAETRPALLAWLEDPDRYRRSAAMLALERQMRRKDPDGLEAILVRIRDGDTDPQLREAATARLGRLQDDRAPNRRGPSRSYLSPSGPIPPLERRP